jgi:hypothetical protein
MQRLILPARVRSTILLIIILPAIALFSLTACNTWQYMTVNSPQLTHNDYNQLVYENDTVRLIYDIAGNDGQVKLRVFNKTNQPIVLNWQRSAFIRNQQTVSFLNKDVLIHGHTVTYSRYTSNFIGSFAFPDSAGFVPPGSEISNDLPTLAKTGPLQIYVPDSLPGKKLAMPDGVNSVTFKHVHYDEAHSPIRFSSYITFTIGHDNKEFSLTNQFYVSDIYLSEGRPEEFSLYHGHGDQIYIRQKTYSDGLAESPFTVSSGIR